MSYKDIRFQWYNNGIKTTTPGGEISLIEFVNATINPKESLLNAFKQIEDASLAGNKKLKDELKQQLLFFVTPSIKVNGRRNYESITEFLPFAVLEYDGIENADVLRDYIFEKMESCIFAFLSPSKSGCKFIFHIETPISIDDYKQKYYGIAHYLDKFRKFDICNRNCVIPLFISYDPDAKFRENAVASKKRGFAVGAFDANKEIDFEIPENIDPKIEARVVDKINFLVDRISDNAHPAIVGISFLIGGWTAGNFCSQESAYDTLMEAIERNHYMSKGTSGYQLTAKQMFTKGLNHPTEFEDGKR